MAKGKRILFLADINSIHTERWVKGLIEKGYVIALYSLSAKNTSWCDDLTNFSYECFGIDNNVTTSKNKFAKFAYFSAVRNVKAFLISFQPDIIHAHYASSYGMLAKRMGFKKTVLSLWGSDVYEFPKRSVMHQWLFKRILKSATVICSTSKDMAKEANRYTSKKIAITPFGIDTNFFTPIPKEKNEVLTIGTVKSLEEVYGIDRLIKLFAEFLKENTNIQLKIYGKGSQKEELVALVNELNIQAKVEFCGFVNKDDLVKAFNSLDIFVALSRSESFGVAVLEAQSCEKPVIVSNVGGLPEVVAKDSGFIIQGESTEEGLRALRKLSDDVVRAEMGAQGRKFVVNNFSNEACINVLVNVYNNL